MINDNVYDIAIIGGGISSCVFTSSHIKNGFKGRIAIIENGRNLGGRASTRSSLSNPGWQLNHGSPHFNICNTTNNLLLETFIKELLDCKIIQSDSSELIELYEDLKHQDKINSYFYRGQNYISSTSMSDLSQKIISYYDLRDQVDYFFQTLIVKLDYEYNNWILTCNDGYKLSTKFLVCSSNLILHKRSLDILKTNQIPLRKAIPINYDKKIDKIINLVNEQDYIKRLTFLIYTKSTYRFKDNYNKRFRYFLLNSILEDKFKFERIIFQKQINNKLGIIIHTRNKEFINFYFQSSDREKFINILLDKFNQIFERNPYINKLIDYQDISIMNWRASQPYGLRIPDDLQVCKNYNIAFCGDWFNSGGFGRIEGAILSALKLSYKINSLY